MTSPADFEFDVPTAELAQAPSRRYCGRCGGPLDDDGCARCAARAATVRPIDTLADANAPSLHASLGLYFALLAVSLVTVSVMILAGHDELGPTGELAVTGVFTAVIVAFALRYARWLAPVLTRLGPIRYYGYAALASLGTFLLASAVIGLLVLLGGEELGYADSFVAASYGYWIVYVLVALQPAIFEEIAFRGVVLGSLERYVSPKEALAVSSAMFAVLHLSVASMPHLFVMGLALALLTRRSGSLYPAMVLHLCHNSLVVLFEQYAGVMPW